MVLHGSYVHGGFHEESDIDIIIVSPAFEGVRPLDRASLLRSILPARVEVICWTPGELRKQLEAPSWRAAFCRGYAVLEDTLGLARVIREATGCLERGSYEVLF